MHFIFFTLGLKIEVEKEEDFFYLYPTRIQDLYTVNIKYLMDVVDKPQDRRSTGERTQYLQARTQPPTLISPSGPFQWPKAYLRGSQSLLIEDFFSCLFLASRIKWRMGSMRKDTQFNFLIVWDQHPLDTHM